MTTAKSTTDTIIHGINILSLNHNYHRQSQEFYRDNGSEVTVTSKSLPHLKNDWLDEHEDTYKHNSIIQSYLEPMSSNHSSTTTIPVVNTTRSKYSIIKSRVKRVFRIRQVDKQSQASLPVFSANQRWSSPSMDSMCSSTTTAAATGSSCSLKKPTTTLNRNSCGFSTASFTKRSSHTHLPIEKNIKSCLKKTSYASYASSSSPSPPPLVIPTISSPPRPTSAIDRKKERWSSIIIPPKKRFSHMMLRKKQSSEMLFTTENNRPIITTQAEEETTMTRGIKFNKYVNVHETWSRVEYDRSSDPEAVCTRLGPNLAQLIKQELNHYKLHEMVVHDSSRINTHFFL